MRCERPVGEGEARHVGDMIAAKEQPGPIAPDDASHLQDHGDCVGGKECKPPTPASARAGRQPSRSPRDRATWIEVAAVRMHRTRRPSQWGTAPTDGAIRRETSSATRYVYFSGYLWQWQLCPTTYIHHPNRQPSAPNGLAAAQASLIPDQPLVRPASGRLRGSRRPSRRTRRSPSGVPSVRAVPGTSGGDTSRAGRTERPPVRR